MPREKAVAHLHKFIITWRIPNYSTDYHGTTLCSHMCQHRSGLQFQLVACPVADEGSTTASLAIYIVCQNAQQMESSGKAVVQWSLFIQGPNLMAINKKTGKMDFTSECDNTFSMEGCHNFMSYEEFCNHLPSYLDDKALTIVCEMGIATTFEEVGQSPTQEEDDPMTFKSGETVAVCAPDNGFWIARLSGKLDLSDSGHPVRVQWFDELSGQPGVYILTQFTDSVRAESIHPVRLVLEEHKSAGETTTYTIKRTKEYENFQQKLAALAKSKRKKAKA